MLLRYIIWIFVIYALFRLIFDIIIPIARVSIQMKKKMREFQDTMHQQQTQAESPSSHVNTPKQKSGDYIDFEEMKS